ncbi:HK97 family phage prohead protease [Streptomyces sp. II-2-2-2]
MELKHLTVPFEIKAAGDDGTFSGYASVFGVKDSYDEVVAPGAFALSIAEWNQRGKMPPVLWQHRSGEPIGVHTKLQEDSVGLYIEGKLPVADVVRAREAHALMKIGAVTGISIGFVTREDSFDRVSGIRTLKRVDLWENSIVTFPANAAAQVTSVKQLQELKTVRDCESFLREVCGMSQSEAKTFLSRVNATTQRDVEGAKAVANLANILRGKM